MRKVVIAECKQEVSTFNPHLSQYADFRVRYGQELIDYHRSVRNEIGGALSVFDDCEDVIVVPTYSACFITSGGTLSKEGWQRIANEFVESIASTPPIEGVYLCMHGAMASQTEWDPEGFLIEETRRVVGGQVPIVVSLDLHGILTDRMLEHADAIVAYHTYPHVDFYETGQRAARLMMRIWEGARPVTAKVAIPALVRGDELITETGLFGQSIRIAQQVEAANRGLSAGMFIGNPFTDVPALQTYSFVITDDDAELAQREAIRIADSFWPNRDRMKVDLISLKALASSLPPPGQGTTALVDAADATSSGASGDSNAILKKLIETGYRGKTLLPMVDAPAVQQAFRAGVGSSIRVNVGGSLDPFRFQPVTIQAKVRHLADGLFRSESFGEQWDAGPSTVLECDNFVLAVSSRAVSLYDRSFFYSLGQNPRFFDAVVVKSPHCQKHMFADWCEAMIHVDAPGSSSANLLSLGHSRCPRPIFPLDSNVEFRPNVQLFQRGRR
jgi:microcystin degradation protein MlrC